MIRVERSTDVRMVAVVVAVAVAAFMGLSNDEESVGSDLVLRRRCGSLWW